MHIFNNSIEARGCIVFKVTIEREGGVNEFLAYNPGSKTVCYNT